MHYPQQITQMEDGLCLTKKRKMAENTNLVNGTDHENGDCYYVKNNHTSGQAAEDVMINTRNIEQFSCSHGNFFVAGLDGVYSKTISGEVLHLWRFCPKKRKLFISRSFLFKNSQDFYQVRQMLQRL